jgi:glucokinase
VTAPDVVVGIDVGGTRVKAALVDRTGTALLARTLPTPPGLAEPGVLVGLVVEVVTALVQEGRATGVPATGTPQACGVVVPGLVDDERGVARWSANLGWRDLPVGQVLEQRLGWPVALGHDVRAGLLAEARWGAAAGARHVLFVPVGTGIAGALMVDGRVLVADGYAGELGHVVVDADGPPCGCGARGCLEAVASASAVEKAYAARTGGSALAGARVGADRVAALVRQGDPVATEVWDCAVSALGRALVMAVTLTGVDLVLVGGGLAESGDLLLDPLREQVGRAMTFQRVPRIARPALGDRAGSLGAACLAWDLG